MVNLIKSFLRYVFSIFKKNARIENNTEKENSNNEPTNIERGRADL